MPDTRLTPDPELLGLCAALAGSGCELYLVGGAVRDHLRGVPSQDRDLLVRHPQLTAPELPTLLRERLAPAPMFEVGAVFGVLKVRWHGEWLDLALPAGRTPDGGWRRDPRISLHSDLARRDFTVNAMAWPLCGAAAGPEAALIDPFGGRADLLAGCLRAVGSAQERLNDDPLRILRAARFAAQGLTPDDELTAAARALASRLAGVAPERLWQEWTRMFDAPHSAAGLRWLAEVGALTELIPYWPEVDGLEQHNPHHGQTVSEHLLSVVDKLDQMQADPLTRQAGLFHDLGKGRTRTLVPGADGHPHGHFYGHEQVGAELTRQTLDRLRADQRRTRELVTLVQLHMRPGQVQTRAAARRLAAAAGPLLEPLLDLYAADRLAHTGADPAQIAAQQALIRAWAADLPQGFTQHNLALSGHALLDLGLLPRQVGQAKRWLTEQVLEGHLPNHREELLRQVEHQLAQKELFFGPAFSNEKSKR